MAQIRLHNFRKYDTLEPLQLNDINIFVGKNNAGKSTVVKALLLVLDNIRSLRWNKLSPDFGMQSLQFAPVPFFRFDANGFHDLHIGTFERAKCNFLDDRSIVFGVDYQDIYFEITISGLMGKGQVSMPIESITLSSPILGTYSFDFSKRIMSFRLDKEVDNSSLIEIENALAKVSAEIDHTESELKKALDNSDALTIADLQQVVKKLKARKSSLEKEYKSNNTKSESQTAIFDLSYYHDNIGENVLAQYIRTFVRLADSSIAPTGTGSVLSGAKVISKNSSAEFVLIINCENQFLCCRMSLNVIDIDRIQ